MAKTKINQSEVSSVSKTETETREPKYVVVRDGFRVEEKEYDSPDDPVAIATVEFWTKVSRNHSWGEKVEIAQYDPRKHRIW